MESEGLTGKSRPESLPTEAQSRSELLSATHVFVVEVAKIAEEPWDGREDAPQQRRLHMQVRLLENLKGDLTVHPGDTFPLEVTQHRQSELVSWSDMGLWSHASPAERVRYLIIAKGRGPSPATLMQEPSCERLFDGAFAVDAAAAVDAEAHYVAAVKRHPGDVNRGALEGARAVMQAARANPAPLDELFGRYLWARVRPAFIHHYKTLLPAVIELLVAPDLTPGLRGALVAALDREVSYLNEPTDLVDKVAQTYFRILSLPKAAPLFDQLVDGFIYNAVFEDGKSRLRAADVLPSAPERARGRAILTAHDSSESRELTLWLGHD